MVLLSIVLLRGGKEKTPEQNNEGGNTVSCPVSEVRAQVTLDGVEQEKPTAIALQLNKLKRAVVQLTRQRERLPQPLFWSIFHTEIAGIKKRRAREQMLRKLL